MPLGTNCATFETPLMLTTIFPADPSTDRIDVPLAICVTATLLTTVTLLR